jgi:hypothetical protein
MGRLSFGDKMPSTYLEVFKATIGAGTRFAILDLNMLITSRAHWVSTPRGTKGMYECTSGACCQSGIFKDGPIQYYALPMWVYLNPPNQQTGNPGSSDGILKVFRMPASLYEQVVTLSQQMDLLNSDLLALGQPAGQGTKVTLFPAQGLTLISSDIRAQMMQQMGDVGNQIERALQKPCSEADWMGILAEYAGTPEAFQAHGNQPAAMVHRANPVAMFGGPQLSAPQAPVQQQIPAPQQAQRPQVAPGMAQRPVAPPAGVIPGMGQGPRVAPPAQQVLPGNFGAPRQQPAPSNFMPPPAGIVPQFQPQQPPSGSYSAPQVGYPPQQSYAEVPQSEVMSDEEMTSMLGESTQL